MMIWLMVIISGLHVMLSLEQSPDLGIRLFNETEGSLRTSGFRLNKDDGFKSGPEFDHSSSNLHRTENFDFHSLDLDTIENSDKFRIPTSIRIARSSSSNAFGDFKKNKPSVNFPSTHHSGFLTKQLDLGSDTSTDESQNILSQMSPSGVPRHLIAPPYLGSFASQSGPIVSSMHNTGHGDSYMNPKKDASNLNLPSSGSASNEPFYSIQNQSPMRIQKLDQNHNRAQFDHLNQGHPGYLQSPEMNSRAYTLFNQGNQQQSQLSPLSNFKSNTVDSTHYRTIPIVEMADRGLTLPILQLQTVPDFSGFMQNAASSPVLFDTETGLQYKLQPGFGASFDFANTKTKKQKPAINTAVQKPITSAFTPAYQAQIPHKNVLFSNFDENNSGPIQLINQGPSKIPTDYVEFSKQTQLHFDGAKKHNPEEPNGYIRQIKPLERTRSDAHITKKKKPIASLPPRIKGERSDESSSNEEYDGDDSYFPRREEGESISSQKHFKEPKVEAGFEPSKSYPFREYDEKFGEQNGEHLVNDEGDEEQDSSRAVKYLNDQDDDDENDASDDVTVEKSPRHEKRPLRENYQDEFSIEEDSDETHRPSKLRNSQRPDQSRKISKGYKERATNSREDMSWRKPSKHKRERSSIFARPARLGTHHRRKKSLPKSLKRRHRQVHQRKSEEILKPTSNLRLVPSTDHENARINPLDPKQVNLQGSQVVWEDSFRIVKPSTQKHNTRLFA